MDACPCGSSAGYVACCGAFHLGAEPVTAEQVMRARYAAFVNRHAAFLIRTSHPMQRLRLTPASFAASFALAWLGLEIIAVDRGGADDRDGMVHFRARYRGPDGQDRVHDERSRFSRAGGSWVYRDARG